MRTDDGTALDVEGDTRAAELAMAAVKAETLIESLAWVTRYTGKTVVVKFGGNAMVDDDLARAFADDMVYLRSVGVRPVVVHGGGPQISRALEAEGIASEFRGGYRVTSAVAVAVVQRVLGDISASLVELIDAPRDGGSGEAIAEAVPGDAVFAARPKTVEVEGMPVQLGRVGEIDGVEFARIRELTDSGVIPVISSLAASPDDPDGVFNVNADDAAGWLAGTLAARKLVVLTDVAGLYRDWPDTASLVEQIGVDELTALLPSLQSGMIPKMAACLNAIERGAGAATIIDGRVPHAILLEIFTGRGSGTEVVPETGNSAESSSSKPAMEEPTTNERSHDS